MVWMMVTLRSYHVCFAVDDLQLSVVDHCPLGLGVLSVVRRKIVDVATMAEDVQLLASCEPHASNHCWTVVTTYCRRKR